MGILGFDPLLLALYAPEAPEVKLEEKDFCIKYINSSQILYTTMNLDLDYLNLQLTFKKIKVIYFERYKTYKILN